MINGFHMELEDRDGRLVPTIKHGGYRDEDGFPENDGFNDYEDGDEGE